MGERLYDISEIRLENIALKIELNDGTAARKKPQYIHLQNERFRLALSDSEYVQMAVAIRTASEKLVEFKGLQKEDVEENR